MTDRLKAWLDEQEAAYYAPGVPYQALRALRAVVELHHEDKHLNAGWCSGCDHTWPCPTLLAIEREVFGAE